MRARRLLRASFITGAASLVLVGPALADQHGGSGYAWAETGEGSATVGAEEAISTSDGPGGAGGGSGTSPCTWTLADHDTLGETTVLVFERMPNAEYVWYLKECTNPDGTVSSQFVPVEVADPDPPPDPEELRDRAVDELQLPSPSLAMSPPGEQVVQVESWLWVDEATWRPHSSSASAGGVTATVTAAPSRVLWDMGDGTVVICEGPGMAYDPAADGREQSTDCSHTYRNSSAGLPGDAYTVTVTIEWDVEWTVSGAPGGGPLPGLTTSTSTALAVAEMQALNQ
jgi:hypothetical protein